MSQAERELKHAQQVARMAVQQAQGVSERAAALQRVLAAILFNAGGTITLPAAVVMDRERLAEGIHVHNPEGAQDWTITLKKPEEAQPPASETTMPEPPKCDCDYSQIIDPRRRPMSHAKTCPARHEFARPQLVPNQAEAKRCTVHKLLLPVGSPCPQCVMEQLRESALCECGHAQLHSHVGGAGRCKRCDCQEFKCAHTNRVLNLVEKTAVCVSCGDPEKLPEEPAKEATDGR